MWSKLHISTASEEKPKLNNLDTLLYFAMFSIIICTVHKLTLNYKAYENKINLT
jgi:hypothetical protein